MRSICQPAAPIVRGHGAMVAASRSVACSAAMQEVSTTGRMLRVRYVRRDQNYRGWALHLWGDVAEGTRSEWPKGLSPSGADASGSYWDLPLKPNAQHVGLLIHKGESKAASANVQLAHVKNNTVFLAGPCHPPTAPSCNTALQSTALQSRAAALRCRCAACQSFAPPASAPQRGSAAQ